MPWDQSINSESNQTAANDIYWKSDYWNVSKIVAQPETMTLVISLNETERKEMPLKTGNLTIAVPKVSDWSEFDVQFSRYNSNS